MGNQENSHPLVSRPDFQLVSSRGFSEWLAELPLSLALTTYHVGGLLMLGSNPVGNVSLHVAAFDRSMGCWTDGQSLWLVTERMVWRFENDLAECQHDETGYDRVFVPRVGYTIGEVDGHEISAGADGRPVFVNTSFSCLATVSERFSFEPVWKPPFISRLVPEDRCHLSGLAMSEGRPKYVSMHARSDVADGWRDFRNTGGIIMDVESNIEVAGGLSMPHSPRVHDGKLWLLNSGTGYLGFIDDRTGKFEPVTFLPGYARGLAFHGGYAFVGLSKPRREHAFRGLPLEKNLADRGAAPRCGVMAIELNSGTVQHWARIESSVEELFDIAVLPGVSRPKALSFTSSNYARQLSFSQAGKIERWTIAPIQPSIESPEQSSSPLLGDQEQRDLMAPRRTPIKTAKAVNNLGLKAVESNNLDDALRCFERAVELDPSHAGAWNNLGNVHRKAKKQDQAIDCYRRAILADSSYAKAYLNLGQSLAEMGRALEAGGCFRRALNIDPKFVDAGVGLGMSLREQGKFDEAIRCFQQVISLKPQSWEAYNGLGLISKDRDELESALEFYEQALAIDPQAVAALANKGSVLRDLAQLDEALACYDRALEIDPECVAAHHNRSMLRLLLGDYLQGWPEYEWRWKQPHCLPRYSDRPKWDGSPLDGRTILLHTEQGLGDSIQFIRYAKQVAASGRVIVQCQRPLVDLFRTSLLTANGTETCTVIADDEIPDSFDVHAPLLSLPALCGTKSFQQIPGNVPYLRVDSHAIENWATRVAAIGGMKVGIAWQGNPNYPDDRRRSFPLSELAPLAGLGGLSLISLQRGIGSEQIEDVANTFRVSELGGPGNIELDFVNTAALMHNLDLVICCNSSLCHLAGALGVRTWIGLPFASDWRFLLDRDDSPWYPSVRLFRQPTHGDWSSVFQSMALKLQSALNTESTFMTRVLEPTIRP